MTHRWRPFSIALALLLVLFRSSTPRPGPGHDGHHRRDRARSRRRRPSGSDGRRAKHGHQFRADAHDRCERPIPRAAAAPRALPGHGDARRVRHARARGSQPRSRPDGEPDAAPGGLRSPAGGLGQRRGAGHRDEPDRGGDRHSPAGHLEAAGVQPQLSGIHEAHPRCLDRPGARRRRAHDQRPERDPEQHLGGRRRLQQPVLRRAARRHASPLHLQPRRGPGGRRRGRRRERRVRALLLRLRQRRDEVRAPTTSTGAATSTTPTTRSRRRRRSRAAGSLRSPTRAATRWGSRSAGR